MAGTAAMALVDYEKDHGPFATKILANALVCRLCSLACNNPLAPTSSPSNVVGLGLFVGLPGGLSACVCLVRSTLLMRRWGWPLLAAAPISWVACEQLRGALFGGFTFAMLGHSQWRWTALLQIADIAGAIGLSGIVMLVAAALFQKIIFHTVLAGEKNSQGSIADYQHSWCVYFLWLLATSDDSRILLLHLLKHCLSKAQ